MIPLPANAWQRDLPAKPGMTTNGTNHVCDDMSGMDDMTVMGQSMAAMANHIASPRYA